MNIEMNENTTVKTGTIKEFDPDNRSRVLLIDSETGEETVWCNVIFPYTGNNKGLFVDHTKGDEVVYLQYNDKQGFVLGQIFTMGETVPGGESVDQYRIDGSNYIEVDRVHKAVKINTEEVSLGQNPSEVAVLGNQLKSWLEDVIDAIKNITQPVLVNTGSGVGVTQAPLANAAEFALLKSQLIDILATQVKVK